MYVKIARGIHSKPVKRKLDDRTEKLIAELCSAQECTDSGRRSQMLQCVLGEAISLKNARVDVMVNREIMKLAFDTTA